MREKALELLAAIGLTDAASDAVFDFIVQGVTEWILNRIHQNQLPGELYMAGAYRVCGQYLKIKKDSGQLDSDSGFDLDGAVAQIQEGDTSITFAVGSGDLTPEQRLENLISYLLSYGDEHFYAFRKLIW